MIEGSIRVDAGSANRVREKRQTREILFGKCSRDRSERLYTKQHIGNMPNNRKFANLMGVDGMTERTGERSRPTDVYFAKGPNLREAGGTHEVDNASQTRQKSNDGSGESNERTAGLSRRLRSQ